MKLSEALVSVLVTVGVFAWIGAAAWFISGGSLLLFPILVCVFVLLGTYVVDKTLNTIPGDRKEGFETAPQKNPEPVPQTAPELEQDMEDWVRSALDALPSIETQPPPVAEAQDIEQIRKSADQGDANAQLHLALMYDSMVDNSGQGVPKDDRQAANWYRLAASQGNASAQYFLSGKYKEGDGVLQDFVQAYAWINLAALGGYSSAPAQRELLHQCMTSEQVAQAQKLAAELLKSIESSKSD